MRAAIFNGPRDITTMDRADPVIREAGDAIVKVDLDKLVQGSQLINGFDRPLPTIADVRNEVSKQRLAIISGTYEATGYAIGGVATFKQDPAAIDPAIDACCWPLSTVLPAKNCDPVWDSWMMIGAFASFAAASAALAELDPMTFTAGSAQSTSLQ